MLGLTFILFRVGKTEQSESEVKKKGRQILSHSKMKTLSCDRDATSKVGDSTISPSNKLQRKREDTKETKYKVEIYTQFNLKRVNLRL